LQKLTNDRLKEAKISFQVANLLPLKPRRSTDQEEFYAQVLQVTEEREKSLLVENDLLKHGLYDVWKELQQIHGSVLDNVFVVDVPFDLVRETILQQVRESLQLIRDQWDHQLHSQEAAQKMAQREETIEQHEETLQEQEQRITSLAGKLSYLSHDMDKQAQLLQRCLKPEVGSGEVNRNGVETKPFSSQFGQGSIAQDQSRRATLAEYERFQQERQEFSEAAIRLAKERQRLELERQAFEAARREQQMKLAREQEFSRPSRATPPPANSVRQSMDMRTSPTKGTPATTSDFPTKSNQQTNPHDSSLHFTPLTEKTMHSNSPWFGDISRIPNVEPHVSHHPGTHVWSTPTSQGPSGSSSLFSNGSILKSALRPTSQSSHQVEPKQVKISPHATLFYAK
jgi:hypothetical protein